MKVVFGIAVALVFFLLFSLAFADHYAGQFAFLNEFPVVQRDTCFEREAPNIYYLCETLWNPQNSDLYIVMMRLEKSAGVYKVWLKQNGGRWVLFYPKGKEERNETS